MRFGQMLSGAEFEKLNSCIEDWLGKPIGFDADLDNEIEEPMRISAICASLLTLSALWASPVYVQSSQGSFCRPVAQFENGILKKSFNDGVKLAQAKQNVSITYLAHSSFPVSYTHLTLPTKA